jgi:hypothetical protein
MDGSGKNQVQSFKPRLLFKFKLEASRTHFILYFLERQKQSIFKKNLFIHYYF